jgi:tol-pal system protein YbgF
MFGREWRRDSQSRQLAAERAILHLTAAQSDSVGMEPTMKTQRLSFALVALLVAVTPAWGVSKEIVQLQTQVQALQDQMAQMKQSFDERMGVMQHLIEQSTDNVNKVANSINQLQQSTEKQQAESGTHVDQVSGQIQALNDTLDELKARLSKVSQQLEAMQSTQQSLAATQAQQQQQAAAPPPDVLYNNALRDYNAGKNDIAVGEFNDYIKYYPTTDLAGNAYFYLADMQFRQGNYQEAVKNYDQVIQNFPTGNKSAAAELKKGFALIELGQKDDGVTQLRHVIQRYPRTNEATQARDRLRKLGVSASAGTGRRSPGE